MSELAAWKYHEDHRNCKPHKKKVLQKYLLNIWQLEYWVACPMEVTLNLGGFFLRWWLLEHGADNARHLQVQVIEKWTICESYSSFTSVLSHVLNFFQGYTIERGKLLGRQVLELDSKKSDSGEWKQNFLAFCLSCRNDNLRCFLQVNF